jgi:Predicted integral membrane protein (DUF2269)
MHLVGSAPWFAVLITIHILGAIVGIGPSFAFGVVGMVSAKAPEGATMALLQVSRGIERFFLVPVVRYTQWTSGVLLIFNRGFNHGFFAWRHAWLIAGIIMYVILFTLGEALNGPILKKMLALAESGAPKAEIDAAGAILNKVGPIYPLFTVAIAVLMILKPGSGCGTLLRC